MLNSIAGARTKTPAAYGLIGCFSILGETLPNVNSRTITYLDIWSQVLYVDRLCIAPESERPSPELNSRSAQGTQQANAHR